MRWIGLHATTTCSLKSIGNIVLASSRHVRFQDTSMKVGELARRTGVSVRTLHYYDEIGLLSPSLHSAAGHRVYGVREITKLQQIRSLQQLGFSLKEIRGML